MPIRHVFEIFLELYVKHIANITSNDIKFDIEDFFNVRYTRAKKRTFHNVTITNFHFYDKDSTIVDPEHIYMMLLKEKEIPDDAFKFPAEKIDPTIPTVKTPAEIVPTPEIEDIEDETETNTSKHKKIDNRNYNDGTGDTADTADKRTWCSFKESLISQICQNTIKLLQEHNSMTQSALFILPVIKKFMECIFRTIDKFDFIIKIYDHMNKFEVIQDNTENEKNDHPNNNLQFHIFIISILPVGPINLKDPYQLILNEKYELPEDDDEGEQSTLARAFTYPGNLNYQKNGLKATPTKSPAETILSPTVSRLMQNI